jgi:hypothetical protein
MLKALLGFALVQQTASFVAPSPHLLRSAASAWGLPGVPGVQQARPVAVVLHARRDKGSLAPPPKRENNMVMNEQIRADPVRVEQAAATPGEADVALGVMSLAEVSFFKTHQSLETRINPCSCVHAPTREL